MPTRTQPQQARSRDKRDRLLVAAATLLQEVPFDEIGTKLIADRAEVSIGSLYRFFPDKEAIFAALLASWLDKIIVLMDQQVADPPPSAIAFVDRLVETYAGFWRDEPGYRQVSLGATALRLASSDSHANDVALADRLHRVLTGHYGVPATPGLHARLMFVVDVADATLDQAFRKNPAGDPFVLGELKVLLSKYLELV